MCGFAGFIDITKSSSEELLKQTVERMAETMRHRGPDDGGIWVDASSGVALGFRRLSILDLSPSGHQHMISHDGRYVIALNGEIYNHQDIKKELDKQSDTEIMLEAISAWGVESALKKFTGMFSFALWDRRKHVLHLVRDRWGIKPLYYGHLDKSIVFGSSLKALEFHPEFLKEIDRDALTLMMRYNCVPAPYTIFKRVFKLLPGHILSISRINSGDIPRPVSCWSTREIAEKGVAHPFIGSEAEATEYLDTILRDAVKKRMVADITPGSFLSGGVDSSLVTALMQVQSERQIKTFSIGFHEAEYNESENAKAVARHLGTEHTELYVTAEKAMEVIQHLPILYDEPFSDSSQIPTFLVSELARKHVTVSLSGDGGDELFGGYNRYLWARNIWQKTGWAPRNLRKLMSRGLMFISPQKWETLFRKFDSVLPGIVRHSTLGDKVHKLAEILPEKNLEGIYHALVSHWKNPSNFVISGIEPPTLLTDPSRWADLPDFIQRMMFFDLISYLPDDGFTKVGQASMGAGLVVRLPLLDDRVVEFAWRLPMSMKIKNGEGKWLLRRVLYKYVPKELIERPKMGFGIPIDVWLRGPMRDWAECLLNESRLKAEGFFKPQPIRQKWKEHLSGKYNWQYHLWDVLMFQQWKEYYKI